MAHVLTFLDVDCNRLSYSTIYDELVVAEMIQRKLEDGGEWSV